MMSGKNNNGGCMDHKEQELAEIRRKLKGFIVTGLSLEGVNPEEIKDDMVLFGSFSKTIAPGFRVGWSLVPQALKEKLVIAAESSILCPSNFAQLAISGYLADQPWREQIAEFCKLYKVRRDAMLESLEKYFPEGATWTHPEGGFYFWVTLPEGIDTKAMMPKAIAAKVAYVPGTAFYADGFGSRSMRLSYCYPTPERIRDGVKALGAVIKSEIESLDKKNKALK